MKCQLSRAVYGRFTDFTPAVFEKIAGRQRAFYGFYGFYGYSLEGYVCARGKSPRSLTHSLGAEKIRKIRKIRKIVFPSGGLNFTPRRYRRKTGVKLGWSCCQA